MAITLIEALDGSGAIQANGNTFVSLEATDTYLENRPNGSAWADLGDDQKKRLLLYAMNPFTVIGWIGGLVQESQPLSWPRIAIRPMERRSNARIRTGFEMLTGARGGLYDLQSHFWPATAIPQPIRDAQCEQAFALNESVEWTSTTQYRRRIIQNPKGLLEFGPNGDLGVICKTAKLKLAPFILFGAGRSEAVRA